MTVLSVTEPQKPRPFIQTILRIAKVKSIKLQLKSKYSHNNGALSKDEFQWMINLWDELYVLQQADEILTIKISSM